MHPVFLEFKYIVIHTYGVMAALGFMSALISANYFGNKQGIKKDNISDLAVYVILSAVIGARVFYVFVAPEYFLKNPIEVLKIWKGGLVFYGGFVFAVIAALSFIKLKNMDLGKTADAIAPGLALGHGIGRIGCFFAGCCYGKHTDLPIGVVFKDPNSLAPLNESLHPTQLYSFLGNFIIFLILCVVFKRKKRDGDIFLLYLLLYGSFRVFIEYFRGDNRGSFIFGILSVSQLIGLTAILISISVYFYQRKRSSLKNNE